MCVFLSVCRTRALSCATVLVVQGVANAHLQVAERNACTLTAELVSWNAVSFVFIGMLLLIQISFVCSVGLKSVRMCHNCVQPQHDMLYSRHRPRLGRCCSSFNFIHSDCQCVSALILDYLRSARLLLV
jgi:hypothetical protein